MRKQVNSTMSSASVAQGFDKLNPTDSILVFADRQPTFPTLRCAQGQALESGGLSREAYRNLGLQLDLFIHVTL
jgi:hypothetical protein